MDVNSLLAKIALPRRPANWTHLKHSLGCDEKCDEHGPAVDEDRKKPQGQVPFSDIIEAQQLPQKTESGIEHGA